jgi:hypothetical protein
VHHRLHASPDRSESRQAQQVESCGSQRGHRAGAITAVTVGILMELGVTDPVPALNAPALPDHAQQCFWRSAQARQEQVGGVKGLAVTGTAGSDFHDPTGADPGLADVLWSLFGAQRPGDGAAVADLVIGCHERDLALSLELATDLAVERLLVGFHRQEEVGTLLLEELQNGFWVWSASAWISTPSRSSSPSSCRSTARSWFSPVA